MDLRRVTAVICTIVGVVLVASAIHGAHVSAAARGALAGQDT